MPGDLLIQRGRRVCVGAPNVLHGRSHDGNPSAREAIAASAADVLCSDCYPSGLLPAVFGLVTDGRLTLPAATALAAASAGAAVGLGGVGGALRSGWRADLILVAVDRGHPAVEATVVGGRIVSTTNGRRASAAGPTEPPLFAAALSPY